MKGVITTFALVILLTGCKSLPYSNEGVIVHLFEWKYEDVALECEQFLAPHGYAAVQISPPSENVIVPGRPWWERYQPVSYNLTTRSGNERELSDMLRRCNKVGIRVFPDVIINHMTGSSADCRGTGGSTCNPDDLYYPGVPYSRQDFHQPQCEIKDSYNTTQMWNCNLLSLRDLNQTTVNVRKKIVNYLNHLIGLGAAGFRIDAAKHINPADLEAIYKKLKMLNTSHNFPPNARPLIYQEVLLFGAAKPREYISIGKVTDFNYGEELGRRFQGWNNLKWLKHFGTEWGLLPRNASITFIENHDTERLEGLTSNFLNYKKSRSYKMAIAFMLAWRSYNPKILSSYEFSNKSEGPPHDSDENILSPNNIRLPGNRCSNNWVCQHRWRQISNMVTFYNVVQGTGIKSWWDNGKNQIAFCRGNKGFIAFNLENYPLEQRLQTCLPEGSYCDIISGNLKDGLCTGKTVDVANNGTALITIGKFDTNSTDDGVLALHIKASITNSLIQDTA